MRLNIIFFLAIFLTSCETTNKKIVIEKDFKSYSNNGFSLIFSDDLYKKKVV